MLKIKDKVDLKELEKFGFKYDEEYNLYETYILKEERYNCHFIITITISLDNRLIYVDFDTEYLLNGLISVDILYDLIESGLVEKVEE